MTIKEAKNVKVGDFVKIINIISEHFLHFKIFIN